MIIGLAMAIWLAGPSACGAGQTSHVSYGLRDSFTAYEVSQLVLDPTRPGTGSGFFGVQLADREGAQSFSFVLVASEGDLWTVPVTVAFQNCDFPVLEASAGDSRSASLQCTSCDGPISFELRLDGLTLKIDGVEIGLVRDVGDHDINPVP